MLGRTPTLTELGVFSALWSEHCSYKHSKPVLKRFPTTGPQVVQGPGENAGVLRLPEGWAVAFKIESHNHPSAVEPYQGAATGVGGILRDVFTMGARPVAVLNSLRFGPLDHPRNRYLFAGVVRGVGDYGNCVGIPTLGRRGRLRTGIYRQPARERDVRRPAAGERPDPRAPRTALATCSSRWARGPGATESTARASPPRSSPRRARPGVRRCRSATRSPRSCCSRRAWSSSPRVASWPFRTWAPRASPAPARRWPPEAVWAWRSTPGWFRRAKPGMTPYEILLSESQERMLVVAEPRRVEEIQAVCAKWELDGHSDRPGHRRRDFPGQAQRPGRWRRSRDSGWWTTVRSTRPRPGKPRAPVHGGARFPACRPGLISRARWSCCSTRRTSPASGGCTSSTTPRCRRRRCWAPVETRACSGSRAPISASRSTVDCNNRAGRARPLRRRQGRRGGGGPERRLHRRHAARHYRLPQLRQSREAGGVLPVRRGLPRHRRRLPRLRDAGHRRQRLLLQRESDRRGGPDSHGRPGRSPGARRRSRAEPLSRRGGRDPHPRHHAGRAWRLRLLGRGARFHRRTDAAGRPRGRAPAPAPSGGRGQGTAAPLGARRLRGRAGGGSGRGRDRRTLRRRRSGRRGGSERARARCTRGGCAVR